MREGGELVRYDAARRALAEAHSIDEVKSIKDKSTHLQHYARQIHDPELERMAAEIRLRARRALGELSAALEGTGPRGGRPLNLPRHRKVKSHTLKAASVSVSEAHRCEQIAKVPGPEFEHYITECRATKAVASSDEITRKFQRALKEQTREARREANRQLVAVAPTVIASGARFATIVIDPPWDWSDEGDQDQLGRARPTYGTLSVEELTALPLGDAADVDAHLYLWITNRSLPKGVGLLSAWGFRYVTCLTWCKPHFGMGNYFRGSTEHVLFGVKGSQALKRNNVGTWFNAAREPTHSGKPRAFYELVESCSPGPYLDMFARSTRAGWSVWGAEVSAA